MTPQEIFDKVARHLIEQGRPALVNGNCKYRTPEGLKCAAGCLIPDELYDVRMEGRTAGGLLIVPVGDEPPPFTMPKWFVKNRLLIDSLQVAHDTGLVRKVYSGDDAAVFDMPRLRKRLCEVAKSYKLDMAAVFAV